TKVADEAFPSAFFQDRGFQTIILHGQKNHHGVAILARPLIGGARHIDWCAKGDARHVGAVLDIAGGIRLENFYVPAGGDVPDPETNDKFAHKLAFLDEMTQWASDLVAPTILVGDLNVAPLPSDVWSHRQLLNVVSHTPPETERMAQIMAAHGWVDVMRHIVPAPRRLFSWWSYRARDWRASDRGRRLDHIWVSPALKNTIKGMRVLEDVRGWDRPSDHAPVLADFQF
ncbi:MAG: exodeoxyribonuclease III, partial [Alphaproteobacteria bacterium]